MGSVVRGHLKKPEISKMIRATGTACKARLFHNINKRAQWQLAVGPLAILGGMGNGGEKFRGSHTGTDAAYSRAVSFKFLGAFLRPIKRNLDLG